MAYESEFYCMSDGKPLPVVILNYTEADFEELIAIQSECFPPPFPEELWWNRQQLSNHVTLFPEGAICIEVDGKLVGSMTGVCVQFDPLHPKHRWEEITDNGYIGNHDYNGNTLYIVDISVRPSYRKLGLGKLMMQTMYQTVIYLGLERLLGGGRIPGYHKKANELSVEKYVGAIMDGTIKDPVINFLLSCGRTPTTIIENYLDDEESHHYALLMEWRNPFK
ncbi:GNAT family N-acetyltransferase [Bacillus sp. AGMB 02131]|uniref:GNAT family N-acetyltransferase n=1 Tax=Peribacillus faecalis TaxID=2772559 RepID=A0A927HBE7_9BACI|nr:GNAT family N-acetyltransferase [Peribacillus faecalis]MBD3108426.1 GNAT family N-acetyltransferase [Peribacillus faecalis]